VRAVIQYATWLAGLPLELLIISTLLRGAYRRFPILLLYSIALFLTTVIEISVNQAFFAGIRFAHSRATYYWIDDAIRQGLLFAVVLSLIDRAMEGLQSRNLVRLALIGGGVALAFGSFFIHHQGLLAVGAGRWRWMTLWVRDMDFAAAVLDLGLWMLLLGSRLRDKQLLLLSGGLGVVFTGEAIGQSLRFLFRSWNPSVSPGDLVAVATSLGGFWILWQALRRPVSLMAPAKAAVAVPPQRDETGVAN
jgi:hypothetical protein